MLVKKVDIILIEVVVRNIAAGSLSKRTGLEEGSKLPRTIIEYYYKDDALGDPMISEEHIDILNLASKEELTEINRQALIVNDVLSSFFKEAGIQLVDFKLEFGREAENPSNIILADEVSPDTCRLWDEKTGEKMDKDRFRRDLGGVMEKYKEVLDRVSHADNS